MTLPKTSDDVKPYAQPALTVGSSEIILQPVEIPKDVRAPLGHRGQRVKLLSVLLAVSFLRLLTIAGGPFHAKREHRRRKRSQRGANL